eukprot:TRINITY_DN4429_c0_g1_i1.p1 TRINITY_DN4429_c0_g1~~TRINITY_DN4429_c0_g1_i1.p1  ORF type:complete len:653 (-),score=134.54 TRINITY_DN4429_c0_g1_i1:209-2167(-)
MFGILINILVFSLEYNLLEEGRRLGLLVLNALEDQRHPHLDTLLVTSFSGLRYHIFTQHLYRIIRQIEHILRLAVLAQVLVPALPEAGDVDARGQEVQHSRRVQVRLEHGQHCAHLQSTVSTVLSVFKPDLDPTAVLDFLTACIHIPRLWQGRDQNLGKNSKPEDVLNLSDNSIKVLSEYVIAEAREACDKKCIEVRVPLILQCIQDKETKSAAFLQQIILQAEDKNVNEYAKHVLLMLYMKLPSLLQGRLQTGSGLGGLAVNGSSESCVDLVSYTLLTSLANTQPGREWSLKMQEYETCARKLMSAHPDLFLRNLPLLVASLQGRTQLEYLPFRIQNHLSLFTIALGLLELARPQIFAPQHSQHLQTGLACFIQMCEAYFSRKDAFYGLIDRFVNFLNTWLARGGKTAADATNFLNTHCQVLIRMASTHGTDKMASLRYLMSCSFSSMEHQKPESESLSSTTATNDISMKSEGKEGVEINTEKDDISLQIAASATPSAANQRVDKEVELLMAGINNADSSDSLANSLQDVLKASMSKPEILTHFQEELCYNICHDRENVRSLAYTCVLRMLRQMPRVWRAVLPAYIGALQCEDQGIIDSALKNLPDLAIICQEEADHLLTTVFRLGLYGGRVSVTSYLSDAINLLNNQIGR